MLIGITGKKRHGKDSVAKILQKHYNYNSDSFADPLRKFGYIAFGITEENREELIESIGITGRQFLQLVGTEIGRVIHQDLWINSLKYRNSKLFNLIIVDNRFPNEAKFIKENNGKIIKVVRPGLEINDSHSSELGIPEEFVDVTIINDSTLEELELKIIDIVNKWRNDLCSKVLMNVLLESEKSELSSLGITDIQFLPYHCWSTSSNFVNFGGRKFECSNRTFYATNIQKDTTKIKIAFVCEEFEYFDMYINLLNTWKNK